MSDQIKIDSNIIAAIDDVLKDTDIEPDVAERLAALVENCLEENYISSDVKGVIDLVVQRQAQAGDDQAETADQTDAD